MAGSREPTNIKHRLHIHLPRHTNQQPDIHPNRHCELHARYLKYEGGNTISAQNGTLGQIASGSFSWSDPIFLGGSWSISYSQYGTSLKVSVTLNDQYSETGQATPLSESQTLAISNPPGYLCSIYSVSATSGSISSGQASNWMPPVTVTITCTPIGNGGK
ncbi:hypothetical protein [Vulcanisaeta sp. JCM 14467]|uniref:hypothetical protein n=1 Tax=Vulcanisaeta sp. JCM 14467 TaxID=1295370 RepID=UPI0006D1E981|nr:hypothetical protein [Vulcanisaeta sp. JCM 14467]